MAFKSIFLLVAPLTIVACGNSSQAPIDFRELSAANVPQASIETLHETAEGFEARVGGAQVSIARAGSIKIADLRSTVSLRTKRAPADFVSRTGGAEAKAFGGVERIDVQGNHLEQSWRFSSRPASRALTVTVEVDSEGAIESNGGSFTLGKSGVVYGAATWVDAKGVRTPVSAKVVGHSIELTVAASVLDQSAYPAVLDPTISPAPSVDGKVIDPTSVTTSTLLREDLWYGWSPFRTVFDGSNYVTAWIDGRNDSNVVMASRISESGAVLDPFGIVVSKLPPPNPPMDLFGFNTRIRTLAVSASTAGTIIAWLEQASVTRSDLFITRIGVDGKKVDRIPVRLATPAARYRDPNGYDQYIQVPVIVGADSEGFRAVVVEGRPGGGIDLVSYRIRSTADSNENPIVSRAVVAGPIEWAPEPPYIYGGMGGPVLVGDATTALLLWTKYLTIGPDTRRWTLVVPISETSPEPMQPQILDCGDFMTASWASDGTATAMHTTGNSSQVISCSVGRDGKGVGTPLVIDFNASRYDPPFPDGDHWVQQLHASSETCFQSFTKAGVLQGPCAPIPPDFDRNSGRFLDVRAGKTTYFDGVPNSTKTAVTRKDTAENVSHPVLNRSQNRQTNPSIATDGESYVVVWRDDALTDVALAAGGGPAMYAARLDLNGNVTSGPIRISVGAVKLTANLGDQAVVNPEAQVIFDGSKFFAVWSEADPVTYFDTYYRRAPADIVGAVLPRKGDLTVEKHLVIAPTRGGPEVSVTSDGVNRVVLFGDISAQFPVYMGSRVSIKDDQLLDPVPFNVSPQSQAFRTNPTIAFDGQRSLAAWSEVTGFSLRIYGRWIPKGEAAIERPFVLYAGTVFAQHARLASDGRHGFLLTWQAIASSGFDSDIWGKFIPTVGEIPPDTAAFQITSELTDERSQAVAVANDGANYLVTWADNRSGNYDIYGSWIAVDEPRVRDPKGVLLSASLNDEHMPSAAAAGAPNGLLVYQMFDNSSKSNAFRLRVRQFSSGLVSSAECTKNEECATRFCVDGFCCSKPCAEGCGVCNAAPGTCTPKAAGAACGRLNAYSCDGKNTSCVERCEKDGDCQPGDHCVSNICEPFDSRCKDDHTEQTFNGEIECGMFKCRGAHCLTSCGSVDDCNNGLVCNEQGQCVGAPELVQEEGCSMTTRKTANATFVFAIGAVALLARAARRRSRHEGGAQ